MFEEGWGGFLSLFIFFIPMPFFSKSRKGWGEILCIFRPGVAAALLSALCGYICNQV